MTKPVNLITDHTTGITTLQFGWRQIRFGDTQHANDYLRNDFLASALMSYQKSQETIH